MSTFQVGYSSTVSFHARHFLVLLHMFVYYSWRAFILLLLVMCDFSGMLLGHQHLGRNKQVSISFLCANQCLFWALIVIFPERKNSNSFLGLTLRNPTLTLLPYHPLFLSSLEEWEDFVHHPGALRSHKVALNSETICLCLQKLVFLYVSP